MPHKTIPIGTYVTIGLLTLFYVFSTWAIENAVGDQKIQEIVGTNPTGFIFDVAAQYVGSFWAELLTVLVVVSFLAALIGFTNIFARYTFALGRAKVLPAALGRTHVRMQSPYIASFTIGIATFFIIVVFIIAGLDPFLNLYTWLVAIGTLGVIVLLLVGRFNGSRYVSFRNVPPSYLPVGSKHKLRQIFTNSHLANNHLF